MTVSSTPPPRARRPRRSSEEPAVPAVATLQANKLGALWSTLDLALGASLQGHSPTSAALLLWLSHWAPAGVVQLARVVGLSQPACSRAVGALVVAGLIEKTPSGSKETWLALTRVGRKEALRLQAARLTACAAVLSPLSTRERGTLEGLIDRLVAAPVRDRDYARQVCRFCDHGVCEGPACPIGYRASQLEEASARARPAPSSRPLPPPAHPSSRGRPR